VAAIFTHLPDGILFTPIHGFLGHELAGEVVEVEVNDFGICVGDRCAIEPYISCGKCKPCKAGRTNCCEQLRVIGIHVDGGMQGLLFSSSVTSA